MFLSIFSLPNSSSITHNPHRLPSLTTLNLKGWGHGTHLDLKRGLQLKRALSQSDMSPIIHVDVPHIQLNVIPFYKFLKKQAWRGPWSCQSALRSCGVTTSHLPFHSPASRRTPTAGLRMLPEIPSPGTLLPQISAHMPLLRKAFLPCSPHVT